MPETEKRKGINWYELGRLLAKEMLENGLSTNDMCTPQPVQLDCRNTLCRYHSKGACINNAPAITVRGKNVVCWSQEDVEIKVEG